MSFRAALPEIVEENANGLLGVPQHWQRVPLEDVAKVVNGFAFPSELFSPTDGVPLIRIRDIRSQDTEVGFVGEFDERYLVESGDLLVGMDGDFNPALWGGERALLNQRVCRLENLEQFYSRRLLFYVLPGYLAAIHAHTSSVTVKHLSSRTIEAIPLPLPPRGEQDRLVAKIEELFSELDAGVAALERVHAKLKRYRASVLKAAVEGRLTEQWRKANPPEETGQELLQRILAERRCRWEEDQLATFEGRSKNPPDNWKDKYKEPVGPDTSDLPELPKEWAWGTVDQVLRAESLSYGILKPGDPDPTGVPMLKVLDVGMGRLRPTEPFKVSRQLADRYARTQLDEGDIVLSVMATLGRTAVVPSHYAGANVNRALAVLKPVDRSTAEFLCLSLQAPQFDALIRGRQLGSAQPRVNLGDLARFVVPLPPLSEQLLLKDLVEGFLARADQTSQVAIDRRRIAGLRQSILKRAFEGHLVPQDPDDEPASVLLERIRAEREAAKPKKKRPAKKPKAKKGSPAT